MLGPLLPFAPADFGFPVGFIQPTATIPPVPAILWVLPEPSTPPPGPTDAALARPFTADGPLLNPTRSRRPFVANPAAPLRGVWENGRWRGDLRLSEADAAALPRERNEPVVILQPARRHAVELLGLRVRADGDIDATVVETLDLAGSGLGRAQPGLRPFGFSSLGGLLRFGEPHGGVRHALAARVSPDRLRAGAWPTWPALGNPVPPGVGTAASNVRIGTLLALPPDVDLAALGLGASGPGYELARALQDFGVCLQPSRLS